MSFIVLPMVIKRFWNCFHDWANLKILRSLKALRADMAPELCDCFRGLRPSACSSQSAWCKTISIRDMRTMSESKMLNLSLTQSLKPRPAILSIISKRNIAQNAKFAHSKFSSTPLSNGYLSCAKMAVFAMMTQLMNLENQSFVIVRNDTLQMIVYSCLCIKDWSADRLGGEHGSSDGLQDSSFD